MKSLLICVAFAAGVRAESLDTILARMDKQSKEFKSATAKLHQVEYTAVIDAKTEEDGTLKIKKLKNGVMLRVDFSEPNTRVVALNGHMLTIYLPKGNQVEYHDVSKYTSSNTVEQLLLLSFGAASSEELKKSYTLTADGTETIDSKVTTRVVLAPKSAEMRKEITSITLWIPEGDFKAVRERVDKPGKNYNSWNFSEPNINKPLSDSDVTVKIPPGVHVVGKK